MACSWGKKKKNYSGVLLSIWRTLDKLTNSAFTTLIQPGDRQPTHHNLEDTSNCIVVSSRMLKLKDEAHYYSCNSVHYVQVNTIYHNTM